METTNSVLNDIITRYPSSHRTPQDLEIQHLAIAIRRIQEQMIGIERGLREIDLSFSRFSEEVALLRETIRPLLPDEASTNPKEEGNL